MTLPASFGSLGPLSASNAPGASNLSTPPALGHNFAPSRRVALTPLQKHRPGHEAEADIAPQPQDAIISTSVWGAHMPEASSRKSSLDPHDPPGVDAPAPRKSSSKGKWGLARGAAMGITRIAQAPSNIRMLASQQG